MLKVRFTGVRRLVDVARPVPGPGQLLVRSELVGVHLGLVRALAAGNAPDPGAEIVGTVVEVGSGVGAEWIGKRVGGVVFSGAYAEYALAAPALTTEIPAGVQAADALAVVRGGLVAMGALRAGRFAAGESIMITGAASGSGHLAVQLARALGASRVLAAVGTADKAEFVRDCGADAVLTYSEPWTERVDVILDGVGGDQVQRGVEVLAPHGRLVAYSAGRGAVDVNGLLADLKTVTGFSVGLLARTRPEVIESYRAELWKLLADGKLRPRHTVLSLDRVDEAVRLIETRGNLGRVMVRTA
ncbi:zinc-binding dehydrogenase [Nocardia sp. NBC_01503]|uniref:quinone oxidoreductase family protein n=1 Tax=Nocardia sp. NBC_01503 TaxID=2975997 RepID=UPI002E7B114D|nr:zinc-binding dehydrogenase [Nocardia sp. NBC_01503]WTL34077.1 zinc-binding dehydrogenase [Nocardia sp. NBC_01503]